MGTITQNPNGDEAPNESVLPESFQLEDEAFYKLHPELQVKYREEFVAIYGGKLVDHDIDPFVLGKRIRNNFKKKFVLIRAVDPDSDSCFDLAKPI